MTITNRKTLCFFLLGKRLNSQRTKQSWSVISDSSEICSEREQAIERYGFLGAMNYDSGQKVKSDAGKPRLTLVPLQIIYDVARVREYAVNGKYKDPDNWKQVSVERYRDAMFRHLCAYVKDPHGKDEESGLPHLWHLATNIAFLCELEKESFNDG